VQRFGADGFVRKPFGRAEVFHAIRSLVQAGRVSARVEALPVNAIPEGMTPEEWNAIPDVAMPDEAHLAAPATEAADAAAPHVTPMAESALVGSRSSAAVSTALRPTPGSGAQTAAFSVSPTAVQDRSPMLEQAESLERSSDKDKP